MGAAKPPSTDFVTAVVTAATVANGNYSDIVPINNLYGRRYAAIYITCDTAHELYVYGAHTTFSALTSAYMIKDASRAALVGDSGIGGSIYHVYVGGLKFIAPRVKNVSGSAAATVSIKIQFFDN